MVFVGVDTADQIAVSSAVHVAVGVVEILPVAAAEALPVAPLPVLPVVVAYNVVGSSAQTGFVDMLIDVVCAAAVLVPLVTVAVHKGKFFP